METQTRNPLASTYRLIEQDLRRQISTGVMADGMKLPGRVALARRYKVGLKTVERAVAGLLQDGTLHADSRRGTFVAAGSRERPVRLAASRQIILGMIYHSSPPTNMWIDSIMQAMERVLLHYDGHSIAYNCFSYPTVKSITQAIGDLQSEGANAFALIQIHENVIQVPRLDGLVDVHETPIVYVSWDEIPSAALNVYYQSTFAGSQAASHLFKQGYRRLCFFMSENAPWAQKRLDAVRSAMAENGQGWDDLLVVARETGEELEPAARRAVEAMLSPTGLPPGIIAANDHGALAFLSVANSIGKKMGQDFGLVGFDDYNLARGAGLTSLRPPVDAMGEEAARLVLRWIKGDHTTTQVRLGSHLVPRASTSRR